MRRTGSYTLSRPLLTFGLTLAALPLSTDARPADRGDSAPSQTAVTARVAPAGQRSTALEALEALPPPRHGLTPGGTPTRFRPTHVSTSTAPAVAFPGAYPVADPARWAVLVYIVGDNDLEEYVAIDIETELGAVGSNADVQVVAVADRSPDYDRSAGDWTGTKLFHIQQGQTATPEGALADLGERNMGDPATLVEFLDWSKTHFPADHYALVFWDHGWGWRPGQTMVDETDGDSLNQEEIDAALDQAGPVDVIGFDACLMQTLEVQATLRPHTRALVASEDYVGGEGFKYDLALTALQAAPDMDAEDMAVTLSESMRDRTISTVALDRSWDDLMGAVNRWADALKAGLPKHKSSIESAWSATHGYGDRLYKDLYEAATNVKAKVSDPAIQSASEDVLNAVDAIMLDEWHRAPYDGFTYGMTIYWPKKEKDRYLTYTPTIADFDYYRNTLAFSSQSTWDDFLVAWTK